jgi:hypothetical protein
MTNFTVFNAIQTARREALVDYYTTYCIPQTKLADGTALEQRIRSADQLYEYLLLDTKIGPDVMTSPVGEAISSLQLYINRCLGGIDPDVNNEAGSLMVEESKPGGFLYDWPDYNQVFSTWAGKERLQYYPSTYLSPELRYNKTELFKTLEDTINQGRISDSRVEKAFQQYVLGFEELANLETISGHQSGSNLTAESFDTFYFIGRSKNSPHSYYWRSCDMAVRDDQGMITSGAWSQWMKINVPATNAHDNFMSPCWFNNRLYVCWVAREQVGMTTATPPQPEFGYASCIWYLAEDGTWNSYRKEPMSKPHRIALVNNVTTKKLHVLDDIMVSNGKVPIYGDFVQVYPDKIKAGDVARFPSGGKCHVVSYINSVVTLKFSDPGDYLVAELQENDVEFTNHIFVDQPIMFLQFARKIRIFDKNKREYAVPDLFIYNDFNPPAPNIAPLFYIEDGCLRLKVGASVKTFASLNTNSAPFFCTRLQTQGVAGLLSYNMQTTPIERDNKAIDFNGSYGLYFWELFFHSVFLIAERYLTEQNYTRVEQWHKYIFSAAGYRGTLGNLEKVDDKVRYWNVVPLQTDQSWNASVPETVDPDVIAMNDPMHYKVAMFLRYVNALIEHGDNCYRMQQRDYLGQAKMYYIQASQMLGPRPVINHATGWPNPTVGMEAQAITPAIDSQSSNGLVQAYNAHINTVNGDFLPPYNDDLLTYWDKLEVRLFNLRHNLTLDGQPLVLPLYATPVSPTELQQRHSAGNGSAGASLPGNQLTSEFRFPVLMDKARTAVSSVIQFGGALQAALQQRDNEHMTLLMQTQQQQIAALTQEVQVDNIGSLVSGVAASRQALARANATLQHYTGLYNNWISRSEQTAMDLRVVAGALNASSLISNVVGAAVEMAPNTFGLACGGSRWGGGARAVAFGLQAAASALETSAQRLDISEQYRRRRSDWQIQKEAASFEVKQLTAQIQSQNQQLAMAQKQKALYAQELSNWRAQYALQSTRFTGLELFNWMTGRLSSLYYQLYDRALALCLTAKAALGREIGVSNTTTLFTAPMWNDLYQGLLVGESLQLELQKMENTFLRLDQRGLEIQKTVSLNTQITRADNKHGFLTLLNGALQGAPLTVTGGVTVQMRDTDKLVITLAIDSLGLNGAYGSNGKVGRFKNISVTLPALLGPYQDVEATLSLGPEVVALSRGLDDSGMFMIDFNDPKYLPFEGDSTNTGMLVLTFFNAGTKQPQRALVESLVDVIFQLRYTLKRH